MAEMIHEDVGPLQRATNDMIRAFLHALDLHTSGERSHAMRVAVLATATGHELGLAGDDLLHLRWAAELHDVGKIGIDSALLKRSGPLSDDEMRSLRLHSLLAERVLESMDWLGPAITLIRHHHERWDGRGYPDGLEGTAIPLGSRIIAVAEAFDAMTAGHATRERWTEEEACRELRACSGSQFDPTVVAAFCRIQPLVLPIES